MAKAPRGAAAHKLLRAVQSNAGELRKWATVESAHKIGQSAMGRPLGAMTWAASSGLSASAINVPHSVGK